MATVENACELTAHPDNEWAGLLRSLSYNAGVLLSSEAGGRVRVCGATGHGHRDIESSGFVQSCKPDMSALPIFDATARVRGQAMHARMVVDAHSNQPAYRLMAGADVRIQRETPSGDAVDLGSVVALLWNAFRELAAEVEQLREEAAE